MMARCFQLFGFKNLGLSLVAVCALVAHNSFAGGDDEIPDVPPYRPPSGGTDYGSWDDNEIDRAALVGQCRIRGRLPSSSPFNRDGSLSGAWESLEISQFEYSHSAANRKGYTNPLCEMFILQNILRGRNGKSKFKDRCEDIRDDLHDIARGEDSGGDYGNFSALDDFFGGGGGDSDYDYVDSQCDDASYLSGRERFACRVLSLRDTMASDNAMEKFAKQILRECGKAGADMRARMGYGDYRSYAASGLHYMGGYCGQPAGPIIIQKENKWYDTVANLGLGLAKTIGPLMVMNNAHKRQAANAELSIRMNKQLGFPSIVTAGSMGYGHGHGYGYGYGNGGYGHGGGYYGGGGYGYTGQGGMCAYGYCPGNGGVHGPGGIWNGRGGLWGGAQCGVPPYHGCVGGPWGVGGAGGRGGRIGGNPWLGGAGGGGLRGPAGAPWGAGGAAGGLPGPYGTANGGNGWYPQGGSGYPHGFPMHGGLGNGAMGHNGINQYGMPYGSNQGAWGPGGQFGGPSYYGSGASPYDARQAAMHAQMLAQQAQAIQRKAQLAQKAEERYQQDLQNLQKMYGKSYQSYVAAQSAVGSLSAFQQTQMGGVGGGGYYSSGAYMQGGSGYYYPPMSAPPQNGFSMNLGISRTR